jgi:hypothetical protein
VWSGGLAPKCDLGKGLKTNREALKPKP